MLSRPLSGSGATYPAHPVCVGRPGQLHRVTAVIARGKRPVPFRTRKLSPSAPMVLRGRLRGRVGHRRTPVPVRAATMRCGPYVFLPGCSPDEERDRWTTTGTAHHVARIAPGGPTGGSAAEPAPPAVQAREDSAARARPSARTARTTGRVARALAARATTAVHAVTGRPVPEAR